MTEEIPADETVEETAPPVVEETLEQTPIEDTEVPVEEERDPLEVALERADVAEKEIAYRDAEIQNIRKRMMAEKAEVIQYGAMGLA